jgi:hypothetical protein
MDSIKGLLKKIIVVIIVLTIAGVAGFMIGKNSSGGDLLNQSESSDENIYNNSSDLRKSLNITLAEHVGLTLETLRVSYDNHESATAIVDELDKNSQELADIIGDFYGDESKSTFLEMWQDHVTYFVNYTVSMKTGDKEGMDQALSDLEDYSRDAAEFFAGLNSNLTTDSTKPLFTKHRDLIIDSIINYSEAEYVGSFDKESQAYAQAGEIGDVLSDGIIKQFPDRFNE